MKKLFVLLVVLGLPAAVSAEDPIQGETIHVPGRAPAPAARVFLSRSRPSPDRTEPRASFTREIVSSTSGSPF